VPQEVFAGVRPGVWVSDALDSQRGHAERWQMCLAHYADLLIKPTGAWEPAPAAVIAATGSA